MSASKSEEKRLAYQQRPPYYTASYLKDLLIRVAEVGLDEASGMPTTEELYRVVGHLREQG